MVADGGRYQSLMDVHDHAEKAFQMNMLGSALKVSH